MATQIVSECTCRDCGQPLDQQPQADGKGGRYVLVTCWNPDCGLRTVTRSLASYGLLTEAELETYRLMNKLRDEVSL